ncbi:MAG: hypothetical protein U0869_19945 [Chloroflexota bacterium]
MRTAKELTESSGGDWEGYLAGSRGSTRRSSLRVARGAGLLRVLCSDRTSTLVGSTYFVDGGMLKV